ncbi:MAG: hypothetical protein COX15_00705 [Candidatus Colwellbacteria bacterium CG23_combo_of_CG06-09_8_20_14_all_42_19]|uniref:Uncharacterized protein n=1 Tax=Candidatus Colwellbacteria bacterium CG23_combo_of_CG06-09_8_20_14_all_42_19 TaxID=1974541 RepID=A0A2H0AM09_9BACT|nr:MAG: hypothetical protein COX15_00705 [Candidatus Colwellbacteria bacterium CG23_combo_of_CG06-09_8_20_14_all_42_19]
MEKPRSLLIMFLAITIVVAGFIYYSYSRKTETLTNGGEPQEGGQQQDANFQGPTGGPYIKGPGGPPPVSE